MFIKRTYGMKLYQVSKRRWVHVQWRLQETGKVEECSVHSNPNSRAVHTVCAVLCVLYCVCCTVCAVLYVY